MIDFVNHLSDIMSFFSSDFSYFCDQAGFVAFSCFRNRWYASIPLALPWLLAVGFGFLRLTASL